MKHLVWLVALAACGDNVQLAPDAAPPDAAAPDAPSFAEAPHVSDSIWFGYVSD